MAYKRNSEGKSLVFHIAILKFLAVVCYLYYNLNEKNHILSRFWSRFHEIDYDFLYSRNYLIETFELNPTLRDKNMKL